MTRTARRIALFLSLVAMATVLPAVDSVPTTPEELKAAGVKPTDEPQRQIDDFSRGIHDWTNDWEKDQAIPERRFSSGTPAAERRVRSKTRG